MESNALLKSINTAPTSSVLSRARLHCQLPLAEHPKYCVWDEKRTDLDVRCDLTTARLARSLPVVVGKVYEHHIGKANL